MATTPPLRIHAAASWIASRCGASLSTNTRRIAGPRALGLGTWSVLGPRSHVRAWSSADQATRTSDGPGTRDGPGPKTQALRTNSSLHHPSSNDHRKDRHERDVHEEDDAQAGAAEEPGDERTAR